MQIKYEMLSTNFSKIPSNPIAYWVSERQLNKFLEGKKMDEVALPKGGLSTTDNNRFLRYWHEVLLSNISFSTNDIIETEKSVIKWYPMAKGGDYRKWYGNKEYIVNWQYNGREIRDVTKDAPGGRVVSPEFYFKTFITWSGLSSGNPSMRLSGKSIFGSGAKALVVEKHLHWFMAFLNSIVVLSYLEILSPTLNYEAGHIGNLPVIYQDNETVERICKECVCLSKEDWDSFETSWDFKKHPLI